MISARKTTSAGAEWAVAAITSPALAESCRRMSGGGESFRIRAAPARHCGWEFPPLVRVDRNNGIRAWAEIRLGQYNSGEVTWQSREEGGLRRRSTIMSECAFASVASCLG